MAEELSLDSIKEMKKADFIKAFKNKAAWKKAKAVIFLVDYKLEGKKAVIAIPFKKENEMKLEMKRLKKEKLHLLKKSGGGTIVIDKNAEGEREATIELIMGGLKPELLQLKASPLFDKIKVKLSATQTGEALEDAAAAESEVDTTENLPEDNLDDVSVDESPDDAAEETTDAASDSRTENNTPVVEEITSLANRIASAFKDRIQPIANAIRSSAATQEHLQQTNETSDLINSLKEKFEQAGEEVKNQVRTSVDKILGLVPNLEKIKTALGNLFGGSQTPAEQEGPLNDVKNLMKTIGDTFKQTVQTVIVPAVKNNTANAEHLTQIETLIRQINELQQKAGQLAAAAKALIDANLQKILSLLANLETLKQRISANVSNPAQSTNPTPINNRERVPAERINALPENPNQNFIEELLNNMESRIADLNSNVDGIEQNISNAARSAANAVASGAQLVSQLFR